ncbi:MAG: hypothetical protein H8E28_00790 [Anaerolineae bacterium]|nr:hypothetical protein [Anaerolineae bacterium]
MHSAFQHNQYLLKRQVFALTGKFRVYGPNGALLLYSQQKMFKLKEDIRIFSDESMTQELLNIQARQIIDFSAAYDVVDSFTNTKVGVLRRKGLRSMLRDEWEMLDAYDQPIGILQEDSVGYALLRRLLLGSLLPQNYDILFPDGRVADLRQRFNLFSYQLDIDFSDDKARRFDHRLGIAAAILLGTIEGKQSS